MKKKYVSPSGRIINLTGEPLLLQNSIPVDNDSQNNLKGDSNRRRFTEWDDMDE